VRAARLRRTSFQFLAPHADYVKVRPKTALAPGGRAEDQIAYPDGLYPPSRRGRSSRPIGDLIVNLGFATREEVERAIAAARDRGEMTGQMLVEAGVMRRDQLARALAERFGVDYVDLSQFAIDVGAVNLVDVGMARRYRAVPVGFMPDGAVVLAMADPTNVLALDEMAMIIGMKLLPAAAAPEDVAALLARMDRVGDAVSDIEELEADPDLPLGEAAEDAPIIRLVHSIIAAAIEQGASDIHVKPDSGGLRVLFRVDGVLAPAATIARSTAPGVVSRIKIMANLDISERRVSQDGRLAVTIGERRVDLRVVTLPLVKGEGAVMRILDTGVVVRDFDSLGMQAEDRQRFEAALAKPHGAILVTGPTGSGKSTTVYSALGAISDGQRNILTIEDPVESQLSGVDQIQVSLKSGVTFANALRSMLRADPDVIMVGEIRDAETAEISIQAALTGHMVLSTLHTRDAASTITRLIDMGVEPFMVVAAIDCVVAQRLARRLCSHCKRPANVDPRNTLEYGLQDATVFEPVGCIRCAHTGYHGRIGLYEVMLMSDPLRTLVLERAGLAELRATARAEGMGTIRDDGIEKVRQGLTALTEIARISSSL
jgi:type IV pilus assembly protein PilB